MNSEAMSTELVRVTAESVPAPAVILSGFPELYLRNPFSFHPETTAFNAREFELRNILFFPNGSSYAQLTLYVAAGCASSCQIRLPGY